jgi:hypothetical protein
MLAVATLMLAVAAVNARRSSSARKEICIETRRICVANPPDLHISLHYFDSKISLKPTIFVPP